MKVELKRLTLCSCGHPTLAEHIPIGTEYHIEPTEVKMLKFRCGGCLEWSDVECVYVYSRGGSYGGYLPKEIFEDPPHVAETETQNKQTKEEHAKRNL